MYRWCCYYPFLRAPTRWIEENLKYGNRDITSGSLVFCDSKGYEAYDRPLPESIYKDANFNFNVNKNLN